MQVDRAKQPNIQSEFYQLLKKNPHFQNLKLVLNRFSSHGVIFGIILISACSPSIKPIPEATLNELQIQVKNILFKKIGEQPDFEKVNDIQILNTESNARFGTINMNFRVAFDTQSKRSGRVTHAFLGKVALERKSEKEWSLKSTEPGAQELVFQDSLILFP